MGNWHQNMMARTRKGMPTAHSVTAVVVLWLMSNATTLAVPVQQVGHNSTSLEPLNTTASPGAKWAFATGREVRSSPTLSADGSVVYIGSDDNSLYAVNTADGSKKWAFATGSVVDSAPTLSADGTVVYVGSEDYSLYAVSTTDGSKKWAFATGGYVSSSPT